ncbi:MAG TPA: 50S ribosomal protein L29 [Rhodanobacteraceae bacterium]|jgi:large subunit ribosomal protein L29|nr:50S ribosomal protein L29 [Rudaea sp.]HEX3124189.1 50S ribosomal protein L29 [Rhodanobacteraceae bacterium]HSJ41194.1 50S ribosomal protein L29 [Xanthobacteraceae bacterium]HZX91164.1 50S ribosomal protein L29 [Rudaea sp.]
MELKELRTQSAQDLAEQLVELRREQFNLRMQKGSGQQKQTHHFKRVKREIAQVKMLIGEKTSSAAKGEK